MYCKFTKGAERETNSYKNKTNDHSNRPNRIFSFIRDIVAQSAAETTAVTILQMHVKGIKDRCGYANVHKVLHINALVTVQ